MLLGIIWYNDTITHALYVHWRNIDMCVWKWTTYLNLWQSSSRGTWWWTVGGAPHFQTNATDSKSVRFLWYPYAFMWLDIQTHLIWQLLPLQCGMSRIPKSDLTVFYFSIHPGFWKRVNPMSFFKPSDRKVPRIKADDAQEQQQGQAHWPGSQRTDLGRICLKCCSWGGFRLLIIMM